MPTRFVTQRVACLAILVMLVLASGPGSPRVAQAAPTEPLLAIATTTKLLPQSNVTYGTYVSFTAEVSPIPGASGYVIFKLVQPDGSETELDRNIPNEVGRASTKSMILPAGTHKIRAVFTGNATHLGSVSTSDLVFSISKKLLTIRADNKTKYYLDPLPALTYTASGFILGDSIYALSGSPTITTTAKQDDRTGSYPITITQGTLKANNYNFSFVNATLTIESAISVTEIQVARNAVRPDTEIEVRVRVFSISNPKIGPGTGQVELFQDGIFLTTLELENNTAATVMSWSEIGEYSLTANYLGKEGEFTTSSAKEMIIRVGNWLYVNLPLIRR